MILRSKIFIILFLVLVFNACQETTKDKYEDPKGAFSIAYFENPIVNIDTLSSNIGNIYYYSFLVQESASVAKLVSYSDYPLSGEDIKQGESILRSAKESALNSLGIKDIVKEQRIEGKDYFGIEIIGKNAEMYFMHYKLILKGNRLFQVGLLKENSIEETEEESEFIHSFQILP
ncbi:MAG: hypothetical protein H6579_09550 [Chitinophagales bacterium]|nr:hypothetical protein [Bacteroidota bacterium]MCB9257363.1 hypothetical protein [Chitinophagales bacterium]